MKCFLILFAVFGPIFGLQPSIPTGTSPRCIKEARVTLRGVPGFQNIYGEFVFRQSSSRGPVIASGFIQNLPPGNHGFHVHEFGAFNATCYAGPHFNPFLRLHGSRHDRERHVGDFGNIVSFPLRDGGALAMKAFIDIGISLCGTRSIVGRTLVVHEQEDDLGRGFSLESLTTGNSGRPIGCGVVQPV